VSSCRGTHHLKTLPYMRIVRVLSIATTSRKAGNTQRCGIIATRRFSSGLKLRCSEAERLAILEWRQRVVETIQTRMRQYLSPAEADDYIFE
jgi:hypothetical protein